MRKVGLGEMLNQYSMYRLLAAILCLISFYGCSTPSPYAANGLRGGFKETKISDNKFQVVYQGNGFTGGDMVWNYWMHRCAELTKEKGFTAFSLTVLHSTSDATPNQPTGSAMITLYDPNQPIDKFSTKSYRAPTYIYVPGSTTTITRYRGDGIVTMFSSPYPSEEPPLLDAQSIIESLGPYVKSEGKEAPPPRRTVLEKALLREERKL
jgi:hypothetical protein